jgi:hypothetical protein
MYVKKESPQKVFVGIEMQKNRLVKFKETFFCHQIYKMENLGHFLHSVSFTN